MDHVRFRVLVVFSDASAVPAECAYAATLSVWGGMRHGPTVDP